MRTKDIGIDFIDIELNPLQEAMVKAGILNGKNIVVSAPTGSGKTFMADLVITKATKENKTVAYAAPLRALARERYNALRQLGVNVALLISDTEIRDLRRYDAIVTTYEKLDSIITLGEYMPEIIILDEIHMLGDPRRGPTIESIVIKAAVEQYIALSATIPNAYRIAAWLNAELVEHNWRPVTLRQGIFHNFKIKFEDGEERPVKRVGGDIESLTLDTDGQVLIFVKSRIDTIKYARSLAKILCKYGFKADIEVESESEKIKREMEAVTQCGVAFHHAGLDTKLRFTIEDAFRERKLKAVVATTTLSAGVNLPARRVIITYLDSVAEYKQMAGRAGRPGLDPYGEAIIITRGPYGHIIDRYIKGEPEEIRSFLKLTSSLRRVMLSLIAGRYVEKIEDIESLLKSAYGKVERYHIVATLEQLEELGVINSFSTTELGWYAVKFYIDPEFAVMAYRLKDEQNLTKIIYVIAHHEEFRPPYRKRIRPDVEGTGEPAVIASAILDWIDEIDEDTIMERYGLGPGDLYHYSEIFDWLATAVYVITRNPIVNELKERVKYGVKKELLDLIQVEGVGRKRARALYNAGIKTARDLAESDIHTVARIIKSEKIARKIIENAKKIYKEIVS